MADGPAEFVIICSEAATPRPAKRGRRRFDDSTVSSNCEAQRRCRERKKLLNHQNDAGGFSAEHAQRFALQKPGPKRQDDEVASGAARRMHRVRDARSAVRPTTHEFMLLVHAAMLASQAALQEAEETDELERASGARDLMLMQAEATAAREKREARLRKQLAERNPEGRNGLLLHDSVQRECPRGPCGVCYTETRTFTPCCSAVHTQWLCATCVKQAALVYARAPLETGAAMEGGGPVPQVDCSAVGARCPLCRRDGVFSIGARALCTSR